MTQPPPANAVGRPPPSVKPGTVIADKYRVERELGRGGFGIVVRATHLTLDRPVAIKVLTEGDGTDADWAVDVERFRREAQATAGLRSDHVVRVLDVDVLESGAPYIVMEFLEGETLYSALYKRGPLPVEEAIDYVVQMLAALAEAHAAGIVHRDLKPANVFLAHGPSGVPFVKVLDFGVSKIGGVGGQAITRTGAMLGTVAYMAPEQLTDAKRVDARADLWSVAQILYEALTKNLPFAPAKSPTLVQAILTNPPVPPSVRRPGIAPQLEATIMRALEKDPAKRFQTAAELGIALGEFASPRSRMALEVLRRARPPAGSAATLAEARGPTSASRSAPGRPASVAAPPAGKAMVFVLAFVIATVVLGVMAALVLVVVRPHTRAPKLPASSAAPAEATSATVPVPGRAGR